MYMSNKSRYVICASSKFKFFLPLITLTKTLADFAIVGTPEKVILREEKQECQFAKVLKG